MQDDANLGRLATLLVQECIDQAAAGSSSTVSWQSEELDLLARELMEGIQCTPDALARSEEARRQLLALLIGGCSGVSLLQPRALECVLGRALAAMRTSLTGERAMPDNCAPPLKNASLRC